MREERTFVAQRPDDLEDDALARWAEGVQLRITRLDDRIEEVRDSSEDQSNPAAVVKLQDQLTLPYYYRTAQVEQR